MGVKTKKLANHQFFYYRVWFPLFEKHPSSVQTVTDPANSF
jgi:hypothetical protein